MKYYETNYEEYLSMNENIQNMNWNKKENKIHQKIRTCK